VDKLNVPRRDHPFFPMCGICDYHSATALVTEFYDVGSRCVNLCAECLKDRTLQWERFAVHVHVVSLDHRHKSSE